MVVFIAIANLFIAKAKSLRMPIFVCSFRKQCFKNIIFRFGMSFTSMWIELNLFPYFKEFLELPKIYRIKSACFERVSLFYTFLFGIFVLISR